MFGMTSENRKFISFGEIISPVQLQVRNHAHHSTHLKKWGNGSAVRVSSKPTGRGGAGQAWERGEANATEKPACGTVAFIPYVLGSAAPV